MSTRLVAWVLRGLWIAAPFTAGPVLAAALHPHMGVRTAASVALWAAWGAGVVAALVAHPISLTVIRSATPAAAGAVLVAAAGDHVSLAAASIGLVATVATVAVAFLPETAMTYVNGPAYPNERRYPLAVPGALLLGPLELTWATVVGFPVGAVLLLSAHQWIAGGIVTVVAVGALIVGGRALHGLSQRWVVFVPAGLVLHDAMSLADPVLFERKVIDQLGPAANGTDALDLTQGASGMALELVLKEKVPMVRVTPGNRKGNEGTSARLMFTPTRPGAVLTHARGRHLRVRSDR